LQIFRAILYKQRSFHTITRNIHGEVEVSFDVLSNGAVSNVNIAKSLCSDCDKEALRLIKEGPQWKVKNGKKDKGKVKIKF
jgi:TonB family protein